MPEEALVDVEYHDHRPFLPRSSRGLGQSPESGGKGSRVRPYEVMIIFDVDLEDDAIRSAVDRSTALIQSRGGTPGKVEWWGKRRFAYEMKHRWEGYYVLLEAEAEPAAMAELDRSLFLADEVLRHKLIRLPDDVAERRRSAAAAGSAGGSVASQPANGA